MSIDIEMIGSVVGPDDYLVLVSQRPISVQEAEHIQARMPKGLHGRVIVTDNQLEAHVVRGGAR